MINKFGRNSVSARALSDTPLYAEKRNRPVDWPSLPNIAPTDQKFVGMFAVFDSENQSVAFACAGAYTVDWGDGNTSNHATGTTAEHTYTYSSIAAQSVSMGFKPVIITITPQSGQTLSSIDLQKKHTSSNSAQVVSVNWIDICIAGSSITSLFVGRNGNYVNLSMLYSFSLLSSSLTDASYFFNNCYSLVYVYDFNTASLSTMSYMFNNCYALEYIPLLNSGSATEARFMFLNCYNLSTIPLINTAYVSDFSRMFQGCCSLICVPLLNTGSCYTMSRMFLGCSSLKTIPLFNTSTAVDMSYMFSDCRSLVNIPALNTSNVSDMSYMMLNCVSLTSIPQFNTSSVINTREMLENCSSLVEVQQINMSSVTNCIGMFSGCSSITYIPQLNFNSASNLTELFYGCVSLSRSKSINTKNSISYENCNLSSAAIDEIFTNLYSPVTGKTITVKGNPGAATCTTSIATEKGWTVVKV